MQQARPQPDEGWPTGGTPTRLQAHAEFVLPPGELQAEAEEMQLAAELLGISQARELDPFLGRLLRQAPGAAARFLQGPAAPQLGALLKATALRALPAAQGARAGRKIAEDAGRLFGVELEGLSNEDQEFQVARRFVRFARDAALRAASAAAPDGRRAFLDAARALAPGLASPARGALRPPHPTHQEQTMHNLDRVLNQQETFHEAGFGNEWETDFNAEYLGESGESGEMDEAQLAAELLGISNEAELDQFFGKVFKAVSGIARSPVGRIIGGALKQAAKTALPSIGAALGSAIPIPGVGTALGGMAGKALANALETETSGMSMEDRDFEIAQGVVRLATAAARNVANAPPGANPAQIASQALRNAVQSVAPGAAGGGAGMAGRGQSGRWVRRGRAIVLLGV